MHIRDGCFCCPDELLLLDLSKNEGFVSPKSISPHADEKCPQLIFNYVFKDFSSMRSVLHRAGKSGDADSSSL